jgi:6-phosphofructokinase 1
LEYVYQRLKLKKSCTIVVSEGCIQSVRDFHVKEIGKDASGNTKFSDIGEILKDQIKKYCMERGLEPELKYINPHYIVRAGRANAHDTKMCTYYLFVIFL